jgi:hypothetical protein
MHSRLAWALAVVVSVGLWPPSVFAISFVPEHIYTTSSLTLDIIEYDASGNVLGSMTPAVSGEGLKGLAFGSDGLLYVTVVRGTGFAVVALDSSGTAHATYTGTVYVRGNVAFGKIALDDESIYVAGQNQLTRFERGNPGPGTSIYTNNQVFDVEVSRTAISGGVGSGSRRSAVRSSDAGVTSPEHYTDIRGSIRPASSKIRDASGTPTSSSGSCVSTRPRVP